MAPKSRADLSLHIFLLALMAVFTTSISTETDVFCLKYIQASLEDPFSYLETSWDFNNNTEGFICRFAGVECWHPDENKVLNLRLSDMGLRGNFPEGLRNCTSLTGLDLSNNELQGAIPFSIDKMLPYLTNLDLSSNNFSGEIPSTIANCSALNFLKLDHNHFSGQIPPELGLLERIKQFSVANNNLSGPVPRFSNATISADNYAKNKGLCGAPLRECRGHPAKWRWRFDNSFEGGFVIGYVVFAVSSVVIYASYCVPWVRMGKGNQMMTIPQMLLLILKKMINKHKYPVFDQYATFSTAEFLLHRQVSKSENYVTRMRLADLLKATENFSGDTMIGSGETGTMHKATLPNGWCLAVKKFSNSQNAEEQFITELKILGKLRHNNINPLIGFCKESRKRLLVYNYTSNGNLFDWLHSGDINKKNVLKWPLRMKIAVGLARALAWLHHCCDFRVAHLNVTSRSVLLDLNFEAKLSNFRMATLINPNEINNSSSGFNMDTEFWEECFVKEDVFNFGIVMLELITGQKGESLRNYEESSPYYDAAVEEVVRGQGHENEMFELLRVASNCVQPFAEQRPSMLNVYATISMIRDKYT
ncbi:BAK1-interacting receptor-like kinase 1 [Euphorbia peplus]|nr:BAK1-interacting receptor-like kinase 1 [Euphorbia peplus]